MKGALRGLDAEPTGRDLLAVFGPPGTGKSTVVKALTAELPVENYRWKDEATLWLYRYALPDGEGEVYEPGKGQAGTARGVAHRGTDLLDHRVQPYAEEWLREHPPPMLMQEGCQVLASRTWFQVAEELGYRVRVFYLALKEDEREKRVKARGFAGWDERWQKGLVSRMLRLAAERQAIMVPAWEDPEHIADLMAEMCPVAAALRRAVLAAGASQAELF